MDPSILLAQMMGPEQRLVQQEPQPGGMIAGPAVAPQGTIGGATVEDAGEKRQAELRAREEARQRKARERVADRQSKQQDVSEPQAPYRPGQISTNETDSLINNAQAQALSEQGSMDRKPMMEWDRGDWGSFLTNIGQGFASAENGTFAAGLAGGTKGASKYLTDIDKRADEFDMRRRLRAEGLEDLRIQERMRQARTEDDRTYAEMLNRRDREERLADRDEGRAYDQSRDTTRREREIADRDDQRRYNERVLADSRKYAEEAASAANARADAKEMRDAAKQLSRDFSEDYVKLATEINKAQVERGDPPLSGDALDEQVLPALKRAYGIGSLGTTSAADATPRPRTLSSQ